MIFYDIIDKIYYFLFLQSLILKEAIVMITFENVSKDYNSKRVLKNINFSINTGEILAIIGESGCGKTTLLKMINALIKPSSGNIFIDDVNIKKLNEIELRRKIGYVIQQTGLFPHMTVAENIELIPHLQKLNREEIKNNTIKLLEMVGMNPNEFLNRFPNELSGGQQQRIGVARAFANNPNIILMDEPFSALDPITRSDLQDELIQLQSNVKKTIVFVTHDMNEAIKIADRICIMRDGEILQCDSPENILKNPIDEFVSQFVGKNRIWSSPEYIKVADIMIEKPITTSKNLSVMKCLDKMRIKKVDSLLVVEGREKKLIGIIKASELRTVEDRSRSIKDFLHINYPVLSPEDNILDSLKIAREKHRSTIPVIDSSGKLAGLITRSALITALSQQYFEGLEEVEL